MSTSTAVPSDITKPQEAPAKTQWILGTPEYLLILVIAFILWTFGFIELLNKTSADPTVFGLYSTEHFLALAVYSIGFLVLGILMARPAHSGWLTGIISYIQQRSWLAIGLLALMGAVMWLLATTEPNSGRPLSRLSAYPFLRFTAFGLLLMASGLILFGGWGKTGPVPLWRKGIALLLAIVLGIELLIQIAALGGLLPGSQRIANLYVPHGRVYQNVEGFGSGRGNNYGYYYPDFEFREGAQRILLLGDSYIQALEIDKEEHLGVALEGLVTGGETAPATEEESTSGRDVEIMALGMPGFGPGLYLSDTRLIDTVQQFQPDEIVLFFHLANDFQRATVPTQDDIVYQLTPDGELVLHPDGGGYIHNLKHYILGGYSFAIDPLATLRANVLAPSFLKSFGAETPVAAEPLDIPAYEAHVKDTIETKTYYTVIKSVDLVKAPGASNFLFETPAGPEAEEAMAIARALLADTHEYLESEGVSLRIVTIPAFPEAFYAENQGADWSSEIGPYDLFGPERMLAQFAQERGIPLLPLGEYLQGSGMTVEQVQALYLNDGVGHFSPEGHAFVAEAVHRCFFTAEGATASSTCTLD